MNSSNPKGETSSTAQSRVWSISDNLRGAMPAEEAIRLILEMTVIYKLEPVEFERLYKQPKASQYDFLINMLDTLPALKNLECLPGLRTKKLSQETVQELVFGLHGTDDFTGLAKVLQDSLVNAGFKKGAEHSTEDSIVVLVKALAGDLSTSSVFDGAAGVCNLTSSLNCAKLSLAEVNQTTRNVGQSILLLNDVQPDYQLNNSLLNAGGSHSADLVVTQPPFGLRLSADEQNKLLDAPYIQFDQGKRVPSSAADALWIQHALYNLNETGRAIMLLPTGWLFRGGYDAKLRQYLLDHDLIEAIIGLPAGLLASTNMPTVLIVLNKAKPESQTSIINFVDAGGVGVAERKKTVLSNANIDLIVDLVKGQQPEHIKFKSVLVPDILKNEQDLNISNFFSKEQLISIPDLEEEQLKLEQAKTRFNTAQNQLLRLLELNSSRP